MIDMNIEIIPNYHPIFVHFTIGLLSVSALLYLVGSILKKQNLFIAARWNLWIGAVLTIGTVIAGFDAYNSVAHDAASHAAMTDHKNWALPTAGIFLALAVWAGWKQRGAKTVIDPYDHEKVQKKKEQEERALTFSIIAEEWLEKRKSEIKPKTYQDIEKRVRTDVLPSLGDTPIKQVTSLDILNTVKAIQERGAYEMANRARTYISQIPPETSL